MKELNSWLSLSFSFLFGENDESQPELHHFSLCHFPFPFPSNIFFFLLEKKINVGGKGKEWENHMAGPVVMKFLRPFVSGRPIFHQLIFPPKERKNRPADGEAVPKIRTAEGKDTWPGTGSPGTTV